MAVFNKGNKSHQSNKTESNTTIITSGTTIKGDIDIACSLYVDGNFEGSINSQKDINIGKNGYIKGDITTDRLVVNGVLEGSVHAKRVEIKADGKVNGTIESIELIIEAKGVFEGNSIMKKELDKPLADVE
ncbi:MAG: polymer-forming cytoskeletal protein [Sulfurimonas sp.]|jgi:cytoskeletal protein CcmA (bactofilin family)|nr:polymer-forming cytoskeletal protein [Sulfurimonadaceae bacterium]